MSPEQRLDELEIRYTHQSELVRSLDRTVAEQQLLLDRLAARVLLLERRLAQEVDALEPPPPHEKPPHY